MQTKNLKITSAIFFILLGLISVIIQIFFTREFLAIFGGSEIVIGLIIFWWFLFIGLGSLLNILKSNKYINQIILLNILLIIFITLNFLVLKYLPAKLTFSGELIPLAWIFIAVPLFLLPICFILGRQFKIATQFISQNLETYPTAKLVNIAYLFECFGYFLGGLVFSFTFINLLTIKIILFLYLVIIISTIFLFFLIRKYLYILIFTIILIVIALIPFSYLRNLNYQLSSWQFKNQKVIETSNSPYGKITVTRFTDQYNFFVDGYLLSPQENQKEIEETLLIPYFTQEDVSNILIIGGGWTGVLNYTIKLQDSNKITYLEPDPKLVKILTTYLYEFSQILKQPQIQLKNQDAISYLQNNNQLFDIIIVNQPPPLNLLFNRFYTQEFFQLIKNNLSADGIIAFSLPGLAENIKNPYQNSFLNSIYQTLKTQFSSVIVIPSDKIFLLAKNGVKINPEKIISRFNQVNVRTAYMSEQYLDYLFENDKTIDLNQILKTADKKINKNLKPLSFLAYNQFWLQLYSQKLVKAIDFVSQQSIKILLIISIIIATLIYWLKATKPIKTYLYSSIILASTSLMIVEIIIILLWQAWFGYLYSQIALILAAIMLGLTVGTLLIIKIRPKIPILQLKKIQLILLALLLIFTFLINQPSFQKQISLIIAALIFGLITGIIFPLVNKLYLNQTKKPRERTGQIYGIELAGTGLFLLIFNFFVIPFFGFVCSLFYLVLLNIFILWVGQTTKLQQP